LSTALDHRAIRRPEDPHTIGGMTFHDRLRSLADRWPETRRRQAATVLAILAIFVATLIASSRLLRIVFGDIDVLAYIGLFVACWVGAGGALVPIPGVRPVSWFMVIQQGAALDPLLVAAIAAIAMVLGQTSYFAATRAAIARHAKAVAAGAELDDSVAAPARPDEAATGARAVAGEMKDRVEQRVRRHATSTAFLVALLPSPLTTIATTTAASAGTSYPQWVVPTLCGYLVFASILAGVGQALVLALRGIGS
jgi:hypothetical protein